MIDVGVFVVMFRLWFDKGTLLLRGEVGTPYGRWDLRSGCYRIKACYYRAVLDYFRESNIGVEDAVLNLPPVEQLRDSVELRSYQNEALDKWLAAGKSGVLVMPTAA